jgi:hypothetical protein
MPESKTDRAHRSNEEITNFHECGDARGSQWLESHPDAKGRAERALREMTSHEDAGSEDQHQISA